MVQELNIKVLKLCVCVYIRVSYVHVRVRLFIAACSSKKLGSGVASKSSTVEDGSDGECMHLLTHYLTNVSVQTWKMTFLVRLYHVKLSRAKTNTLSG